MTRERLCLTMLDANPFPTPEPTFCPKTPPQKKEVTRGRCRVGGGARIRQSTRLVKRLRGIFVPTCRLRRHPGFVPLICRGKRALGATSRFLPTRFFLHTYRKGMASAQASEGGNTVEWLATSIGLSDFAVCWPLVIWHAETRAIFLQAG